MRSTDVVALAVAGLGAVVVAALVSGTFYGAGPMATRMEAAPPVAAGGSGPSRPGPALGLALVLPRPRGRFARPAPRWAALPLRGQQRAIAARGGVEGPR